jgi:hypothetical protein
MDFASFVHLPQTTSFDTWQHPQRQNQGDGRSWPEADHLHLSVSRVGYSRCYGDKVQPKPEDTAYEALRQPEVTTLVV